MSHIDRDVRLPTLGVDSIIVPVDTYLSDNLFALLKRSYPGLEASRRDQNGASVVVFETSLLAKDSSTKLFLDLTFLAHNLDLPLENVCNRFDTYFPKTEGQGELLTWARRLTELGESQVAAGLLISGPPGVGKTHIAVSAAKELMMQGADPIFARGSDTQKLSDSLRHSGPGRAWIIDDLDSPYSIAMDHFVQVVYRIHEQGGRIMVTSNSDFSDMFRKYLNLKPSEAEKFADRVKGMFRGIVVDGESFRQRSPWYQE